MQSYKGISSWYCPFVLGIELPFVRRYRTVYMSSHFRRPTGYNQSIFGLIQKNRAGLRNPSRIPEKTASFRPSPMTLGIELGSMPKRTRTLRVAALDSRQRKPLWNDVHCEGIHDLYSISLQLTKQAITVIAFPLNQYMP